MWPFDHPFGTYGWPGPFGWVAHNCPGNVVAGFIQVGIAALVGTLLYPPTRRWMATKARQVEARIMRPLHAGTKAQAEHNAWVASEIARLASAAGHRVDPHPHFGQHDAIVAGDPREQAREHLGTDHPAYAPKEPA